MLELRERERLAHGALDGILQYSRAGRMRERVEPVDTGALAHEAVDLLALPEGAVVEEGAPALVRLVAQVASRFGAVVSEKVAAQAVPVRVTV